MADADPGAAPRARRNVEHLLRPRTAGTGLDVFAVEPDSAQVVWSRLAPGTHRLELRRLDTNGTAGRSGTRVLHVESDGGSGSVVLDELEPGCAHQASLDGQRRRFRTLRRPPGEELFRFATVSDLHLGRGDRPYSGPLAHLGTHQHTAPHTGTRIQPVDRQLLCATAAVEEALDWGAELLVVKGDVCEESYEWIWDQAAELFGGLDVPVRLLPGNHDTGRLRQVEPEHAATQRDLSLTRGVDHLDVPGLRIVLVDSTRPGNGWGAVARHGEQTAQLASEADGGVFVATHHHPQRVALPLFWPHGIPGGDARSFCRQLGAATPSVLVSSGHTHRCRVRRVEGVRWGEVAATNHFPGVWAGYRVYEGGLVQTVRRFSDPGALGWTEHTRRVLGGVWALWATGTLSDRSFSLHW